MDIQIKDMIIILMVTSLVISTFRYVFLLIAKLEDYNAVYYFDHDTNEYQKWAGWESISLFFYIVLFPVCIPFTLVTILIKRYIKYQKEKLTKQSLEDEIDNSKHLIE